MSGTKVIGVTGQIGSGKSLVCEVFSSAGIPVYKSDERAKELIATNQEIRKAIVALLKLILKRLKINVILSTWSKNQPFF